MNKTYPIVLALSAALFTIAMLIYAGHGWEKGINWWAITCLFGAWAISPYIGIVGFSRTWSEDHKERITRLLGFILVIAFGIIVLIDGFFIHSDAQNALLFIFLPLYQWIGIAIVLAVGASLKTKEPASGK